MALTGPDNQVIVVNPAKVVSVREPRGQGHFPPGTRCLLQMVDGKFIAVAETCAVVYQKLQ